jgi:hypothetical protein
MSEHLLEEDVRESCPEAPREAFEVGFIRSSSLPK